MQEKMVTDGRLREEGQGRAWDVSLGGDPAPGTEPAGRGIEVDVGVVGTRAIRKGEPKKTNFTILFPSLCFQEYSFMFNCNNHIDWHLTFPPIALINAFLKILLS